MQRRLQEHVLNTEIVGTEYEDLSGIKGCMLLILFVDAFQGKSRSGVVHGMFFFAIRLLNASGDLMRY